MSEDSHRSRAVRWFGRPLERLRPSERRVLESALHRRSIATDPNATSDASASVGDRLADAIARVGGSWSFILGFLGFLAAWALANTVLLRAEAFDPYPFIFLNLVLSMLAAIQAPIIMMSQNRSAERDRVDAAADYEVNLKSELEIMALHEKLDELRGRDTARMADALTAIEARLARLEARLGTDAAG